MKPADVNVIWPTAEQIARAVFVAAALEGHDALDVLQGTGSARARAYAAVALAHQFPTAPRGALGRKCGNDTCLPNFRSGLKTGKLKWFDLARLNAVRAALGWSDMTFDEALDAPMLYCGRPWEEFVDRAATARAEAPTPSVTPPKVSVEVEKPQVSPGTPSPRPSAPRAPSPAASALASAARTMQSAKPQPQRVTPSAQVTAVMRRALNNAPPAATGKPLFAPAPKDTRNEIADTRRPQNELQGRLLNESLRGVTSFRPDPPAEKRGAVNVTAEFCGDPPAHRSALAHRES